jgi:hypothetical protein
MTTQLVVGQAGLAFRDLGAMATCQSKEATYGRKTATKKDEA